ncbi:hypothetical protein Pelo_1505 [Pelomyxa schiedti]|nr:hypothetical protein Pelo_1505 [Pelomyxa schiedti]
MASVAVETDTPATRWLTERGFTFVTHPVVHQMNPGETLCQSFARQLSAPAYNVLKTMVFEYGNDSPCIVVMHGDAKIDTAALTSALAPYRTPTPTITPSPASGTPNPPTQPTPPSATTTTTTSSESTSASPTSPTSTPASVPPSDKTAASTKKKRQPTPKKAPAVSSKPPSAKLAPPDYANSWTGYVFGGTSPFGLKREIPVVLLQRTVAEIPPTDKLYINGGSQTLVLEMVCQDFVRALKPTALVDVVKL